MYILHRTWIALATLCLLTACAQKKFVNQDQTLVQSPVLNSEVNWIAADELLSVQGHSILNIDQTVLHPADNSSDLDGLIAIGGNSHLDKDQAPMLLEGNVCKADGSITAEGGSQLDKDQAALPVADNASKADGSITVEGDSHLDKDQATLAVADNVSKVGGSIAVEGDSHLDKDQAALAVADNVSKVEGSIATEGDSHLEKNQIALQAQSYLNDAGETIPSQADNTVATGRPTPDTGRNSAPDTDLDEVAHNNKPSNSKPQGNLWDRLFSLYAIPHIDRREIDSEIRRFEKQSRYFQRVQDRAAPFLYDIVAKIEENGMPGEIALLPVVESGFRPHAYSRERASGVWQFTPATAERFGLNKNWWYDGRRDVYSSTIAAVSYLKFLHRRFNGDWLLALAAYNSGEGTVGRAIRRNRKAHKPTDFWHLKLPRETRNYVPRLLALARMFRNADEYGIEIRPISDAPALELVDIGSQMDLAVAAKMAQITIEELSRFNPGFKQWATSPDGPHRLLVPAGKAGVFQENLAGLDKKDRIQTLRHRVRSGETLSHIAKNYGTTILAIRKANSIQGHVIHPDKSLAIPFAEISRRDYYATSAGRESLANRNKITYVVRSGDSFWEISRKYAVSTKKLAKWNNMTADSMLMAGRKLTIWLPSGALKTSSGSSNGFRAIDYTVRRGDSLYRISRLFNVKIVDLKRWNVPRLGKYLQPGQKLTVGLDEI